MSATDAEHLQRLAHQSYISAASIHAQRWTTLTIPQHMRLRPHRPQSQLQPPLVVVLQPSPIQPKSARRPVTSLARWKQRTTETTQFNQPGRQNLSKMAQEQSMTPGSIVSWCSLLSKFCVVFDQDEDLFYS